MAHSNCFRNDRWRLSPHVYSSRSGCGRINLAFLEVIKTRIMAKRPRIAVVGSANIDLTTFTERFPKPGETIFGQKFDLGFGGKGANQAVAAKLCGASVFMVARVGSDLFGPSTIENFKKMGIDATHVKQVEGVSSG